MCVSVTVEILEPCYHVNGIMWRIKYGVTEGLDVKFRACDWHLL